MDKGGVILAWTHPGQVAGLFMESVMGTVAELGDRVVGWISQENGPLLASGRNLMVKAFLSWHLGGPDRKPAEWFVSLDTDMVWDRSALPSLLAEADAETTPIIGGLCFGGGRGGGIFPTLYVATDEQLNLERVNEWPKGGLCRVDATGAAFLVIHRSVFERMYAAFGVDEHGQETAYPWFAYGANAGKPVGEDIAFCLRARALEIPVHVHTGVTIGHLKSQILTEDLYDALRDEAQTRATAPKGGTHAAPARSLVNLKRLEVSA